MTARMAFTNEQLDRLTEGLQAVCLKIGADPKGHVALKIAAKLREECDGHESVEEIVYRFAA